MISRSEKRQRVLNALHRTRLEPYLKETNENEQNALKLYTWHLRLTSSVQELLGVVEVTLRNAIDRELLIWNENECANKSWLLEAPAAPLGSLTSGKRKLALRNAEKAVEIRDVGHPRHQASVTHDDVLANVMFGMWKDIMPNHGLDAGQAGPANKNRKRMWDEAIHKAFPHSNDPDGKETYWRIIRLHLLRNRVSHMESLLGIDLPDRVHDMNKLVESIDPYVAEWFTGLNRVNAVLKERPKF